MPEFTLVQEMTERTSIDSFYDNMARIGRNPFLDGEDIEATEFKNVLTIDSKKLLPKNINKLSDWSISARALKRVIKFAICGTCRYDYKFQAYYDSHYNLTRIWNCATNNVICTIKRSRDKTIIRYREKSYYRPIMSDFNDVENIGDYKILAIPSKNLSLHRNSNRTNQASKTLEAEIGFRSSLYRDAMIQKGR